jgi:hypothetical protein
MSTAGIVNIFAAIVTVALVATLVNSTETAHIITAWGQAFSGSLRAAEGH